MFTYHQFLRVVKETLFLILGRGTKMTTHVFRKTGYLFALWGNGEFQNVRIAARHATEIIARSYAQDALSLRHIHLDHDTQNEDNAVPTWRPNFIFNTENATILHSRRISEIKTLDQLAESFVASINETMPIRTQLLATIIIPRLYTFQPVLSNVERIRLLIRPLQPNDQNEILTMINTMARNLQNSVVPQQQHVDQTNHQRTLLASEINNNGGRSSSVTSPSVRTRYVAPPTRIFGDNDLVGRTKLKEISDAGDKLHLLLSMHDEAKSCLPHGLTKGARSFFYSNLQPLHRCFTNHCNSDSHEFLKRWKDDMSHYRFRSKCCDGLQQCKWSQ
jgi:hypothetical protein